MNDDEKQAQISLVRQRISELEVTKTSGGPTDSDFADLRANAERLHVGYRRYLDHLQQDGPVMGTGDRLTIHLDHEVMLLSDSSEGSNWATQVEILLHCAACDETLEVFVASDGVIGLNPHTYDVLEPHVGHDVLFTHSAPTDGGDQNHTQNGVISLVCVTCNTDSRIPKHLWSQEISDWFEDLWLEI
ncbi:MAG: hypothetical protein CL434_08965 [Acidimicrobiaceae bacterium]|mgnify:CR=1 FL=1|nr:hypothetical protein [Acidimicrobiaceae bacterium]